MRQRRCTIASGGFLHDHARLAGVPLGKAEDDGFHHDPPGFRF